MVVRRLTPLDVNLIRARFIKGYLDRALMDPGSSLAERVVREFSRYIAWFSDSLPNSEREAITSKLRLLQSQIAARQH
jgi:hypothetical protein